MLNFREVLRLYRAEMFRGALISRDEASLSMPMELHLATS